MTNYLIIIIAFLFSRFIYPVTIVITSIKNLNKVYWKLFIMFLLLDILYPQHLGIFTLTYSILSIIYLLFYGLNNKLQNSIFAKLTLIFVLLIIEANITHILINITAGISLNKIFVLPSIQKLLLTCFVLGVQFLYEHYRHR